MSDIIPGSPIVVSVHNSGPRLRETPQQLARELDRDDVEVIIVENGFSDDIWEIIEELALGSQGFPIRIFRSEVGLGAAYLKRASGTRGEVVLSIADDLPSDITDIRSQEPVGGPSALVIGSKAHPGGVVSRSKLRAVMSWGYRPLCRVILGMTVGDRQGIPFVNRTWLQRHAPLLREHGYLVSTEIVYLAQANRRRVVEVPVVLQAGHGCGGTRVRIANVWDTAVGLVRLRRRRHMLRVTLREP